MTTKEEIHEEPVGEGVQEAYLPDIVPAEYIRPPSDTVFANATWLHAGPEVRRLVEEVMAYPEHSDLAALPYSVVWRRRSTAWIRKPDIPLFVSVEGAKPRDVWEATQMEAAGFPHFYVDLHWQFFDDLRSGLQPGQKRDPDENPESRGAQYVHEGVLQQHIDHALSCWYVENGILHKQPPDFMGYAKNVERFGLWNEGLTVGYRQLSIWGERGDE